MTDLEQRIDHILAGRRSPCLAVSRAELVLLTGSNDRACREAIAQLQGQGRPIVSVRKGYFLGDDDEVGRYKRREWRRIRSLAEKLKAFAPSLDRCLDEVQFELGI